MSYSFDTNELVYKMRRAKGLTQKQLAELLHTSTKTVSNWERKRAFIDGHTLSGIYKALDIEKDLFVSSLKAQAPQPDIQFYVCPFCKNVVWSRGGQNLSCCNMPLSPLIPKHCDKHHIPDMELSKCGINYEITFRHPMTAEHYISFIAYVSESSVTVISLEPDKAPATVKPVNYDGNIYLYCTKHGLYKL